MSYVWMQKGPEIVALQQALIRKGFKLDRYGADGSLAGETWKKVEAFAKVDRFPSSQPLPQRVVDEILSDAPLTSPKFDYPDGYVRVKGDPADVHGQRGWQAINTIVLHQTGIWMTDTPERFRTLDAHVGILDTHATPIVQVQELTALMYHANEANRFSVGIEINGLFPGLARNFVQGKHTAVGPTTRQIHHACIAMRWICDEVAAHGGRITRVIPHRCSNDTKKWDPGEVAWKEIGLWAQDKLGLSDCGPGWKVGDGSPIPYEWVGTADYEKHAY